MLQKRAASLGDADLIQSTESTFNDLIRLWPAWRSNRDPDYLGEMAIDANALKVLIEELRDRDEGRRTGKPAARQLRGF